MFMYVCVGLCFFVYVHIFESVSLNGSLSAHFMFFCVCWCIDCLCMCVSICVCEGLCVQTSRISIQTDHYNQLLLNFFFLFSLSEESTRICHNSFYWLDQCLLPGNISLLNTLHQKVMGSAQALLNIALPLLGNTNSNFGF